MQIDQLRPHQTIGAQFISQRPFTLLADEPGLGKTATTITGADLAQAKRILVSCPAVVREHWAREFCRWQTVPRSIEVCPGSPKGPPKDDVFICSHASLVSPEALQRLAAKGTYDLIVLDESHEFRTLAAKRTMNLYGENGLWRFGKQIVALTGTPIVNSAADLYPLFHALLAFRVPPGTGWWEFCRTYTDLRSDGYDGWKPTGIKDPQGLAALLKPFLIRRTLESAGVQLPPLSVDWVAVPVPQAAMTQAMAGLENWTPDLLRLKLEEQDELRDAAISRVRKAIGLAKSPSIAEHLLALLRSGVGPVVVFFQHTDVRKGIYESLCAAGHSKVSWIDGTVTRRQLAAAESWFQNGKIDVLLVQTQAGGMGLTLTRANQVVVAELPWTATALWQAIKRVHRLTQGRSVDAKILLANQCWIDQIMAQVVWKKHQSAKAFLDLLV